MMLKYVLIYFALACLLALVLYGIDKYRARRHLYRISEKTLLLCGLLGGAAGALAAMQVFRHKTRHGYFYVVNLLGLAWQVALVVYLLLR